MTSNSRVIAPKAAAPARRRGRPQRLPDDASPSVGHSVSADQRVAWLLATSRILGPDPELAHQENFAQALRGHGFSVDNSRVSRWESGSRPLQIKVISAYEQILGLPDGALVAVAIGVYRSRGTEPGNNRRTKTELRNQQEIDDSFERAEAGVATGADWLRLAEDLTQYDRIYLNPSSWRSLSNRLVNELNRSVGAAFVRRREACTMLLGNPAAQRHLVRAIGEVVTNPHAQIVQPVVSLLGNLDDPAASALVLRLIESDNPLLRRAAASIAPVKLARQHFAESDLGRLEAFAALSLRRTNAVTTNLQAVDLAATLPGNAFDRVCREVRDNHQVERLRLARTQGHLVPPETARAVSRAIATRAQEETGAPLVAEPDTMLQRLVSEAMFHTHKERREQASLLLAASAYAPAIAHGCLTLTETETEFVAARALAVLQAVGLGQHREIAVRHATRTGGSPAVQVNALNALALSTETMAEDEAEAVSAVVRSAAPQAVRQAALFAVGMNAPERLESMRKHDDVWLATRADWWRDHGSALHDTDDVRQPTANPTWIPAPRHE